MFPLNDTEPNRYSPIPYMTITLIAINTGILIWELRLPEGLLWEVIRIFGFTPSLIWAREGAGALSLITSTFLHGGIYHLASNMLFLWVFGRRVEDACGPGRFLLYYLLSGATAGLFTAIVLRDSPAPGIGASGAIFGVMGAYLVLYPVGRIRTLIILGVVPVWPKLRAFWIVFYYLFTQIPNALIVLSSQMTLGVGYWAHLGGFFACLLIPLFVRPEAFSRYLSNVHV
jgi:membrane associated rhomboid family serine protease